MKKKNKVVSLEDYADQAQKLWKRTLEDVSKGLINHEMIAFAMTQINTIHYQAIKESRRDLLV